MTILFQRCRAFWVYFGVFQERVQFLVAKVFVCGSESALGLVFESLWSIGFVMPNISSMYLLWASLSILLTRCLDSRWACLSAGRLYCLYLLNKWFLLRMDLLMSCVIHGSDDLVLIVRWGTYCSIPLCRALLKSSQSELTVLSSQVDKKDFWNANMCVSKPSQSAFSYMNISLGFCLEIWGFIKTSERTESWSAMPGLTSTDLTKVGLTMRNKSRMFSFLVGWVTINSFTLWHTRRSPPLRTTINTAPPPPPPPRTIIHWNALPTCIVLFFSFFLVICRVLSGASSHILKLCTRVLWGAPGAVKNR